MMGLGEAIREMEASLEAVAASHRLSDGGRERPSAAPRSGELGGLLGQGQRASSGRSLTASNSSSMRAEGVGQALRKAARPPRAPKPPMSPNPLDDPSLPERLRSSSYRIDHHDKVGAEVCKLPWFILMDRATLMKRGVRRTLVQCSALTEPYVGGVGSDKATWLSRIWR